MSRQFSFFVAILVMAALPLMAMAEENVPEMKTEAKAAPQMSEEEAAMHEAWMKAAMPGEAHKHLANDVGEWTFVIRWWMAPGTEAMTSKGTSSAKMIYDGRYVKETVQADMGGHAFEGESIVGYDNLKNKYVSIWLDNASTGIMYSEGDWDEKSQSVVMFGTAIDPMTGKEFNGKSVITMPGENTRKMEYYQPGPDGKMFKSMEIDYKRVVKEAMNAG